MDVLIWTDEWYPVHTLHRSAFIDEDDDLVTIPDEFYERYRKTYTEFMTIQEEIEKLL